MLAILLGLSKLCLYCSCCFLNAGLNLIWDVSLLTSKIIFTKFKSLLSIRKLLFFLFLFKFLRIKLCRKSLKYGHLILYIRPFSCCHRFCICNNLISFSLGSHPSFFAQICYFCVKCFQFSFSQTFYLLLKRILFLNFFLFKRKNFCIKLFFTLSERVQCLTILYCKFVFSISFSFNNASFTSH